MYRVHSELATYGRKVKGKREDKEVRKSLRLEDMETSFDFCQRMTKVMDSYKEKVSTTLVQMDMDDKPTTNDIKVGMDEGTGESSGDWDGLDGMHNEQGSGGDGCHARQSKR